MGRKKYFKILITFLCIFLIGSTVAGCGNQGVTGDSQGKEAKKYINIGILSSPVDLNPVDPGDDASAYMAKIMYEPLSELDEDMTFKPMLADSIETSDNTVFTIKLNKDAKWTDGQPVTTDDVIFAIKLICNPEIASMFASNFSIIEGTDDKGIIPDLTADISGIKKIDDKTLQLKTKAPISMNLFQNSICRNTLAVPQHVFKNVDLANFRKDPNILEPKVTNGAYKLVTYKRDQYIQMEANKDYFRGAPIIDTINFKIMPGSELTVQLENGEIDMNLAQIAALPLEDYDKIKKMSNITTKSGEPNAIYFLFINHKSMPDVRVRKAISYAVNRKMIVDNLYKGEAEVVDSFFTSNNPYLNKDLPGAVYDPEKAKQLLKEAGWDSSKTVNLIVSTSNKTRVQAADIIAENLKSVGINVKIQKMDHATAMNKTKNKEYDLTLMADTLIPVDPTYDLPFFVTSGNFCGYDNPKVDELVEAVKREIDDNKVKAYLYDLQKILAEDVPMPIFYATKGLKATSKRVIYGEPKDYGTFIDVYKWDVKQK
ncbi:ABC-type dipeptide transport system, periplasmic component [Desulfosporosinus orientis DSM 765]|uniref:ABC-type dipeptide transport system, periplasmic component n=1 Tax=Desulfosporosinus orientis (strain ATCC 19365 / DSM 765 / NCIMB 8382 / VKM B-1628 / Singapore I) TaxID=768706 RepID=G7WDA0_DESOD|nr:ABC transporter substrate-binding protein [Desulfosporosinus orientis]AET67585.1 ABC-type dipeptide transport system, periplasmic component [Desulfosporosinus orientis DSM 765]